MYCIMNVRMKCIVQDIKIINSFKEEMKGVFTLADLKNLFPLNDNKTFYRRIKALEKENILNRAVRKIYVTENYNIKMLSQKINSNTYISFETVLSEALIIGTVPEKEIKALKVGKKREYITEQGKIIHLGISGHLYFGFNKIKGINIAVKEKAFLDTLYFYLRGNKYYFDIFSDIDVEKLDIELISKYLKNYKNPKFIKFVRSYLDEFYLSE